MSSEDLREIICQGVKLTMNEKGEMTGSSLYKTEIIAKLFGVGPRRIQQMTKEGILPAVETPKGRLYDLVPTIQTYVKYLSDKANGKNRSEREIQLREQKMEAEISLKESQSELHRLKTDIAAGKYIAVNDVISDYERFFVTFKKFAMSLPARLTGLIGGAIEPLEARRIEKELQAEIIKLLRAFVVAGVTEDRKKK